MLKFGGEGGERSVKVVEVGCGWIWIANLDQKKIPSVPFGFKERWV